MVAMGRGVDRVRPNGYNPDRAAAPDGGRRHAEGWPSG